MFGTRGRGNAGTTVGTRGCEIGNAASSRSETWKGEKQKEPFSALNESKVACSQRDRVSTGRPPSVCVVGLRLELET